MPLLTLLSDFILGPDTGASPCRILVPPAPALIHSPTLIQSQQVQLWTVCELLFSSPEGPDAAARGHLSPFRMQTLTVPTWLPSDKLQDVQGDAQDR